MKFVSQCGLVGALVYVACAVPVDIVEGEDVLIVSPDASFSSGGSGGGAGTGNGGTDVSGSGAGGALNQGGAGVSTGGSGFTQGGAGGAVSQGGAGGGMGGGAMAMGGSAGTGMGGTGVEPPPTNCVETGSVSGFVTEVFYTENVQAQSIGMTLAIRNTGAAFNMNQLKVRYWYTPGTTQPFVFECYYAQTASNATITDDIQVTFGQNAVSAFADITVDRDEAMGTGINQIQLVLRGDNYANLSHTDDFSFVDGAANMINRNMSAYVDDVQVFGCEPPNP